MVHGTSRGARGGEEERQGRAVSLRQAAAGRQIVPHFLAIAERNPEGPDAIEALCFTLWTSDAARLSAPLETWDRAIKILRDYHLAKPSINGQVRLNEEARLPRLWILTALDHPDTKALVAEVNARNPDRKIQAILICWGECAGTGRGAPLMNRSLSR
jgi:hypothetical protein